MNVHTILRDRTNLTVTDYQRHGKEVHTAIEILIESISGTVEKMNKDEGNAVLLDRITRLVTIKFQDSSECAVRLSTAKDVNFAGMLVAFSEEVKSFLSGIDVTIGDIDSRGVTTLQIDWLLSISEGYF